MRFYLRALYHGLVRIIEMPRLSLPVIVTLSFTLTATLTVVAMSSNLIFKPLPDIRNEASLYYIQRLAELTPDNSISMFRMREVAELAEQYKHDGMFGGYELTMSIINDNNVNIPTNLFHASQSVIKLLSRDLIIGELPSDSNRQSSIWISESLWSNQFSRNPSIIGKTLQIDGETKLVQGVLSDFQSYDFGSGEKLSFQVWAFRKLESYLEEPFSGNFGSTVEVFFLQERNGIDVSHIDKYWHDWIENNGEELGPRSDLLKTVKLYSQVSPYRSALTKDQNKMITLLLITTNILLLMACLNLLNLFIAYFKQREQEIATQYCLGANKFKLIVMVFCENLPLFLISSILGLIGAAWGIRLLPTLSAGNLRLLDYVHLDIQTVVVALLLVFVINTVFSMLCVVQFNPQKLVKTLNNIGNKGVSSGKVTLLSRILFILQLSFASLVLVGSVLLAKSAYEEFNVDFGFARKNTAVLNITYHPLESATDSASQEDTTDDNFDDVGIAIREQVTSTLLKNFKKMHVLQAQDDPLGVFAQLTLWKNPDDGEILTFIAKNIGPDYINIFDIPLLLGRNMTEKEYQNRDNVVLINSTMARVLAKSDDLATVLSKEFNGAQIIGVIPEHYTFTQEDKGYAQVLYNDWNWSELGQKVVVLLPKGDTFDSDKVISLIESSHPLIKEVDMIVIEERWSERSLSARVQFYAISVLCIVTLLLAAIGSQGMAMNFAELKRFELAIRMTTGASRWGLIKRVVKEFSGLLVISFTVACAIASGVYGSVNQRTDVLPPLTWQSMSVLNSVLLMLVLGTVVFVVWRVVSANPMGILREQ